MASLFSLFKGKAGKGKGKGESASSGRMEAFVVEHGPTSLLAYGLEWRSLDGLGSLEKKAKKMASDTGARRYTVVRAKKASIEPVIGLLRRAVKAGQGRVVEAAAACFAAAIAEQTEDSALYVGPGPKEGSFVLLGILHGIPSPEFDVVGDANTILLAAENYQPYLADGKSFYVHSELLEHETTGMGDIHELLDFIDRYNSVVRQVPEMPYASTAHSAFGGVMDAPSAAGPIVLAGGAFLGIAVLAGGYYLYQDWDTKNSDRARETALLQAAMSAYQTAVDSNFKSEDIQQAAAASVRILGQINPYKTKRDGWRVTTIKCEHGTCKATFVGATGATFEQFMKALQPGEKAVLDLSKLNEAAATFEIQNWADVPVLDLASVPKDDVTVTMGTQAQTMQLAGVPVSPKERKPMAESSVLEMKKAQVVKYEVGAWDINGPLDTLVPAMNRLPKIATLSSLEFVVTDRLVTFKASGRYFTVGK